MNAKRQRKDEEKRRILELAEADRRSRMDVAGAGPAVTPAAEASAPSRTPDASRVPRTAKLQVRCQRWQLTVVYTCFTPQSTLADVRRCVHEELVKKATGLGDGRTDGPRRCHVPDEDEITLVESVPPRRRFTSQEDLQQTLLDAGLCPSSVLLVEAPAPEPLDDPADAEAQAPPVAAEPSVAMGAPEAQGHRESDGDDHADGGDSDGSEDHVTDGNDDDDEDDDGRGFPGGPGGPGFVGGWRPPGGGTGSGSFAGGFGGGGRGRPARQAAPSGPRIGPGGQILGSATSTAADGGDASAQQRARESRLAALERRGASTQAPGQPAAAAPAAPVAAPTPAAAPSAAQPMSTKRQNELEREGIMRRIAEERAEREAAMPRTAAAGAVPAPTPAEAAAPASAADTAAPAVRGRVPGQMGGGANKAERAKERERILQQMNEDRDFYEVRHTAAAVQVQPAAPSTSSGSGSSARLQLRCAASARSATKAFEATAPLSVVQVFAAAEFGHAEAPTLALTFPPYTVFEAPEQLSASLASLGLCPSATLRVVPPPSTFLAAEAGAEEAAQPTDAAPAEAGEPAAAPVAGGGGLCPRGHPLAAKTMPESGWCDKCSEDLPEGANAFECEACDLMLCAKCHAA